MGMKAFKKEISMGHNNTSSEYHNLKRVYAKPFEHLNMTLNIHVNCI